MMEETAELGGVLGRRGQDRCLRGDPRRSLGWGPVPGEAARALLARQTQVPCSCLLLTPPSGLKKREPGGGKERSQNIPETS